MDLVRFADAPRYTAPNHEEIVARRLQGGQASTAGFVLVGHSEFPPGAIVPMDAASIDRIYLVARGVISIAQADGVRHVLEECDSIFVPAGEARSVANESGASAAIIVITPAPAS